MSIEWRKPWYLLIKKSTRPQIVLPLKAGVKLVSFDPHEYDNHYYVLQEMNSDLLIAIDNDDVVSVRKNLKKDKIDVNISYKIPSWEVPDAYPPQLQTFLHRALWERSENVFRFLLKKGANPRIEGHCHDTVIGNLFDGRHNGNDLRKFGTALVDAGMTAAEIRYAARYITEKDDKDVVTELVKMASAKVKLIQKQGIKKNPRNNVRVRE